jgi:hypothetical protein
MVSATLKCAEVAHATIDTAAQARAWTRGLSEIIYAPLPKHKRAGSPLGELHPMEFSQSLQVHAEKVANLFQKCAIFDSAGL